MSKTLTEKEKEALYWRCVKHLEVKQIADALGIHSKTVYQRLTRAKRKLKADSDIQACMLYFPSKNVE